MFVTRMNKRARSVTRSGKYFAVAASPFNAVKLALGVIILVGGLLTLVTGRLVMNPLMQVLLLGSYGMIAALWLMIKTRQVARQNAFDSAKKSSVNSEFEK